jgi:hypothetical protein
MSMRPAQAKGPSVTSGGGGGGGSGDVTNGSNVGAGAGLSFKDKLSHILRFRSLLSQGGVGIVTNANDITISSNRNVDGGDAAAIYLTDQDLNGGGA